MQDRLLTLALTRYEDSLCGGCGHPKDEAYEDDEIDSPLYYDVQEVVCQACKAHQEFTAGRKEPHPGAKVYVVAERPPGR